MKENLSAKNRLLILYTLARGCGKRVARNKKLSSLDNSAARAAATLLHVEILIASN